MPSLRHYERAMIAFGGNGRMPESNAPVNTLWIPVWSGNRTACLNLNHTILGFDKEGRLWGENGNCGTMYRIIQVPDWFTQDDVLALSEMVKKVMGRPESYPSERVLKADERIGYILESLEHYIN